MKKMIVACLLLGASGLVAGENVFGQCIQCHGTNAHMRALGQSQVIAGWPQKRIVDALKGYQKGTYGGPMKNTMKVQASKLSDAQIKAVAKHISSLKP